MTITSYVRVLNGAITERGLSEPVGDQSKLAPHKPRILPYEEIRAALKPGEVYGAPVEDIQAKKVVATWPVRKLDVDETNSAVVMKVAQIKGEAQRRILEIMPAYKQTNWLARKAELDLTYGPDPTDWPADDKNAIASVLEQWEQIKTIRARSNELEAALSALTKPADVLAFDPTAGWEA